MPPSAEKFGVTEEIFGRWLKTKPREAVIVATKITGPGHGWFTPPVRHGNTALDRQQIIRACEASLRRLDTDYIDLYQTHWPDHGMPYEEVLGVLTELRDAGKVRVIGCSNETCWGMMKSHVGRRRVRCRPLQTVQNNFSLINRRCESELAQVCRQEGSQFAALFAAGRWRVDGQVPRRPADGGAVHRLFANEATIARSRWRSGSSTSERSKRHDD